jgi:hypothetical protein
MDTRLVEIGQSLVDASQQEDTSARGLVTELFPFIFTAARRMSARSISRFLKEGHNVKISAVTISRALKEPEKHLEPFAEEVEPQARLFASCHGEDLETILENQHAFDILSNQMPIVAGNSRDEELAMLDDYRRAEDFIRYKWFGFDPEVRSVVSAIIANTDEPEEENAKESK